MKKTNIWNRMSGWLRAFLILALVFLALGLGTLGSLTSTGKAYALTSKSDTDGKEPCIVLNVSDPGHGEEGHEHRDLYIKEVYFNLGGIYTEYGETVTIQIARGTSADSSWTTRVDLSFANLYEKLDEGEESEGPYTDCLYNWVKYTVQTVDGWRITTYPYYRIKVEGGSVLINEIVFVANDQDVTAEGEHKPVALRPTVYSDGEKGTLLPYDRDKGETLKTAVEKAGAIVDSPCIPSMAQSSFFRFGQEEIYSLMTISEMRLGKSYVPGGIYHIDSVYNALGNDILAFGTLIGGMSPFGLRLMPFLASFGVLVFGFLFVRKLTGSDKAGLVFAVLYALCGVSMSLGHFGTPLMVGLFFITAALFFTTKFFKEGLKKASYLSAVPVLLAGLFTAAAVCVNGAFAIPAVGVVGLFIAGLVRQTRKTRAALDVAIDEVEADEAAGGAPRTEGGPSQPRKKLAAALKEHRFKGSVSGCVFFAFLLLGGFLISILAMLPMYFPYVKVYDNPASPSKNIFYFVWKALCGGFTGENYLTAPQSVWSPFYLLFKGTGETFGVTAAGSLIAVASLAAGVIGAILALVLLTRKMNADNFKEELLAVLIPLVGVVIGLATAAFAKGGLAFMLLAYICLFAIAAKAASEEDKKYAKVVNILSIVCFAALAVCFGLFAVFTFSIPTAGFLPGLWA